MKLPQVPVVGGKGLEEEGWPAHAIVSPQCGRTPVSAVTPRRGREKRGGGKRRRIRAPGVGRGKGKGRKRRCSGVFREMGERMRWG